MDCHHLPWLRLITVQNNCISNNSTYIQHYPVYSSLHCYCSVHVVNPVLCIMVELCSWRMVTLKLSYKMKYILLLSAWLILPYYAVLFIRPQKLVSPLPIQSSFKSWPANQDFMLEFIIEIVLLLGLTIHIQGYTSVLHAYLLIKVYYTGCKHGLSWVYICSSGYTDLRFILFCWSCNSRVYKTLKMPYIFVYVNQ